MQYVYHVPEPYVIYSAHSQGAQPRPFPSLACALARATRSLEHALGKNAGNFPGVVATRIDRDVLAWQAQKIRKGAVVISATNGKTTTTNLAADCLETAGASVFCNREGSNLETGIVTALLNPDKRDFACLECDEMYARFVLPKLRPRAFVLLNLFEGDQIYRFGSMERIYASIAQALESSPETIFIYNADDPHCQAIAERVPNPKATFGMAGGHVSASSDTERAQACPACGEPLAYTARRYDQIGRYSCPACSLSAPEPDLVVRVLEGTEDGYTVRIERGENSSWLPGCKLALDRVEVPCTGEYMLYNIAALRMATTLLGCPDEAFTRAIAAYDPRNGRLQRYAIEGRSVLSNLAKNPVGFNQNIQMALKYAKPQAVGFYMDDMVECNGDYSWVDDIDFGALRPLADAGCPVFYGGEIAAPLERALATAGIPARRADTARETLDLLAQDDPEHTRRLFVIGNYHALERLHAELEGLEL